ncbi:FadR/GntR family transcriptional regulator [Rhodoplanes sp.]|uniref:FadR/GntR family transcriptional regulator n=1 Tax=Rhodoplanes sp. TaxID=1968906 RepID=UPI0025CC8691|nr:FCD domain-containing protein [Rhodoplanes sp.]
MGSLVGPEVTSNRVDIVARQLVEQLRSLGATDTGRLPSERRLAAIHNCSRNTIREALARLRDRGMIEVRPRSGSYEPATPPRDQPRAVDALAALDLVGPEVARLVATAFRDEYVERLEEITSELSRALLHRDAGEAGRQFTGFYAELGRLAGNPYLHRVLTAIEADEGLVTNSSRVPQQRAVEAFFTQHVDVLQALRRGDSRRVGKLAQRCIRAFANLVHVTPTSVGPASGAGP